MNEEPHEEKDSHSWVGWQYPHQQQMCCLERVLLSCRNMADLSKPNFSLLTSTTISIELLLAVHILTLQFANVATRFWLWPSRKFISQVISEGQPDEGSHASLWLLLKITSCMFMCVKSSVNRSLTNGQKYASVISLGNLQEAAAENSLLIFKKENTILDPAYELRKNTYVPKLLHPVLDITKAQWGFISINRRDFEAGHCTLLKTGKQQKYATVNGVVKICPFCNIWA